MNKWIAIALLSIFAAGCKQGLGERCQSNDDCAEGICSSAEPKVCVGSNNDDNAQIDAMVPIDTNP